MARTNEAAVRQVIDTDLTTTQVEAFIDDASAWVTAQLATAGFSTTTLTAIEKYLACHFITLRDPRLKSAQMADVMDSYQRDLYHNEYLRTAAGLDTTGSIEDAFMAVKGRYKVTYRVGTGYADET